MKKFVHSNYMKLWFILQFVGKIIRELNVEGNIEIIMYENQTDEVIMDDSLEDNRNCRCGTKYGQSNKFIVGGEEATPNEFPWVVGLYQYGRLFCGGTLISEYHVLTAGHCLDAKRWSSISAVVGAHNHDHIKSPAFQVWFANIEIHRNFTVTTFDCDIALIKLDRQIIFGEGIQPICLPTETESYEGKMATVAGWGFTREGIKVTSSVLRKVNVPIRPVSKCKHNFHGNLSHLLCAYYDEGKKDACQGDSGGPLMLEKAHWELIGIVSWGIGCAREKSPAGYTKVDVFLGWIKQRIGKTPLCNS